MRLLLKLQTNQTQGAGRIICRLAEISRRFKVVLLQIEL